MTRSLSYVADRSKTQCYPIILFDGAEVEIFMDDLSLFPVVTGPVVKGWEIARAIVFGEFSTKAAAEAVLGLVTDSPVCYGFAILSKGDGETSLGVFERVSAA